VRGTPWVLCFALFSCAPDDGSVAINDQCYAYYPDSVCPPEDKSNRRQLKSCDELGAYLQIVVEPSGARDYKNEIELMKSVNSSFECADNYGREYFRAAFFTAGFYIVESKFDEAMPIIDDSIRRLEVSEYDYGHNANRLFKFYSARAFVNYQIGNWVLVSNDLCAADKLLLRDRIRKTNLVTEFYNDNLLTQLKNEIDFSADNCQGEIK
jgi:hypothetical protein